MKTHFYLLFFLFNYFAISQDLIVYEVNSSSFPTIKAKFFAIDASFNQITNLSVSDFEVKENGLLRTVTNVSCPAPTPPTPISSVLTIDVSGSMANGNIDIAKSAARAWVNMLPLGKSECAITSFNGSNYLNQDFTTNRTKLLNAINSLSSDDGTSFDQALFEPPAGSLKISKNGKHKKVIVFLTDGESDVLKKNEIISEANLQGCAIFSIVLGINCPENIKEISTQTGGAWYENIRTEEEAVKIYQQILVFVQSTEPCEIEWLSDMNCKSETVEANLKLIPQNVETKVNYIVPNWSLPALKFSPSSVFMKNVPPGATKDTNIAITAYNGNFVVSNITLTNPKFTVNRTNFTLNNGQTTTITVRYTASDSNYNFTKIIFENNLCPSSYFVASGFTGVKTSVPSLKLTHPNGGETFVVGTDTVITWEGIPENDTVKLYYSIDNGVNWKLITEKATGLKYIWKNIPKPASNQCLVKVQTGSFIDNSENTAPDIEWEKTYGGSGYDRAQCLETTYEGGSIVGGWATSVDGDIVNPKGAGDAWIIKLNPKGEIEWKNNYGGSNYDEMFEIHQTLDSGFIIGAQSSSDDMDLNNNKGKIDLWIFKINKTGAIEWSKNYGGSEDDYMESIFQTRDGGYIVAATTKSNDYDVQNIIGGQDYWVLKLDPLGNLIWQKSYGGSRYDDPQSIIESRDGGYVIAGVSNSYDGDINDCHGVLDYWVVKIDENGILEWQKTFGGTNTEYALSVQQTQDDGYIIGGYSSSTNGDITNSKGGIDYWIVKIDATGEMEWQKSFGGSQEDWCYSAIQTKDNGYVAAGCSNSDDGDVNNQLGIDQAFLVKLNQVGEKVWAKSYGTKTYNIANSIKQLDDGTFIVCGYGFDSSKVDMYDYWIIKLSSKQDISISDSSDAVFSIVEPLYGTNDIDMQKCLVGKTKDSVITPFISNIGTYKFRVDSIFFTGTDAIAFSMLSGFPIYEVQPGSNHFAEIRFIPNKVGIHNAVINIITQADTIKRNIIGEGVEPQLAVLTDILDFGLLELGNEKIYQDTALLKNISSSNITITDVVQLGPDLTQFEIVGGGGSFTLAPGEERKLSVKFKAKYGGRCSGQIGFKYNGTGSPAVARLFGTGIGGTISIEDDSAYIGDEKTIKLILGKINPAGLAQIAPTFEAKIKFQSSVLAPTSNNYSIVGDSNHISLTGNLQSDSVLAYIPVVVGLGTTEETTIDIEYFILKDNNGEQIEYDLETQSGIFKLLGICKEGGKRLFYPSGKAELFCIVPNPADNEITVTINTIEAGDTYLYIYNSLGMEIFKSLINNITTGSKEIKINTSSLSNGIYYLKFQTPTSNEFQKLIIER